MAILAQERYARAFEPGCSIGELTLRLAQRCNHVDAIDLSATAVSRFQQRCHDAGLNDGRVSVEVGSVVDQAATGYDVIVFSELGYYSEVGDLGELVDRLVRRLELPALDSGATDQRLLALVALARHDVSEARLAPRRCRADPFRGPPDDGTGTVMGRASQAPNLRVLATPTRDGFRLSGHQGFCGGAGVVDAALVTIELDGTTVLVALNVANLEPGRIDTSAWVTSARAETATATVDLDRHSRGGEPANVDASSSARRRALAVRHLGMVSGPCGGVRADGSCELGDRPCSFVGDELVRGADDAVHVAGCVLRMIRRPIPDPSLTPARPHQ